MTTTVPVSSAQSTRRTFGKLLVLGLVSFFALLVCIVIYVPNCKVRGFEFQPGSWQVREFEFWAEPFTNTQLTGIQHNTTRIAIDPSITGLLKPSLASKANRWDLVELNDYRYSSETGPAAVLVDMLTTHRLGWRSKPVEFWTKWTTDNPAKAKELWHAAQTLTIHNAYASIPDLLDLALSSSSGFSQSVKDITSVALLEQAKIFLAEGDLEKSVAAATSGLAYNPQNAELKRLATE